MKLLGNSARKVERAARKDCLLVGQRRGAAECHEVRHIHDTMEAKRDQGRN